MSSANVIRYPGDTDRLLELGRTGSGKTTAGLYHLAKKNWDVKPWIIFDTKGDPDIEKLGRFDAVKHIKINEQPGKNGLYIVRPLPNQEDEINEFLWKIWARNNVGLYFDEGYMLGKPEALNALLTQGRSKHIPIILLSQRPTWLPGFCFTEASYIQVYSLIDTRDQQRVREFTSIPREAFEQRLPEYHSIWYDVAKDRVTYLKPTPPSETILASFKDRLSPKRLAI